MTYAILFTISLILSLALIPLAKKVSFALGILDHPKSERKIHNKPMPLLGGLAIFVSFVAVMFFYIAHYQPDYYFIPLKFYFALAVGGLILMVGGFFDDKYDLSPKYQFIFPVLATLVLVFSGIGVGIKAITNPLGPTPISLNFAILGIPFSFLFIFMYVMGMIYTTKFLDGMDGLAGGVSFIAGLTLFFLSLSPKINQSITASLAIIFCGAVLGFLIYNFNPASIFLGEGGSEYVGFMLGAFSVLLGGKIATAVLVMGIPIMDVAWAITRRLMEGKSPFKADRKHLHFRLLDIGFSQRQTVLILYALSAGFGFMALFLQSLGKLISLIILILIMIALAMTTVISYRKKHPNEQ
jgi:UDP-GlcNAc:undecaprenyl-phosphate GlcNAc-1-phosphate transferase